MAMVRILVFSLAFLTAMTEWPAEASEADASAVRHVMMAIWDRPEARLEVDPIVIAGDHAIAGWSQGGTGGRALLRRKGDAWDVILCAGDDLKRADVLRKVGLAPAAAAALANDLAAAEMALAPGRLALFSKFEGLVVVSPGGGGHGRHTPQQGHK
jgi:hypothetical protein